LQDVLAGDFGLQRLPVIHRNFGIGTHVGGDHTPEFMIACEHALKSKTGTYSSVH